MEPTRVLRITRVVLTLDLIFSLIAGGVLYALSSETADYFAWTIKLPLTATFLGAGYLGAVAALLPSYRAAEWRRVRIIAVMGFTLTFVTAVVTFWHLEQFHLGAGSTTARVAGWAWLVVYLLVPVSLAAIFLVQERAGGRREYAVAEPLLPLTRLALLVQAAVATVLGIGLVFRPATFDAVWPWPLPPLSAGAVGAWLLTIAAGSWWALREGDWGRFRFGIVALAVFLVLVGVGAARYPQPLDAGDWQEWTFLSGLALLAATFAIAARQQHRRRLVSRPARRRV